MEINISRSERMDKYFAIRQSVVLFGYAGTGKTSLMLECFKRNGAKVAYWSAVSEDFYRCKPEEADILYFDNLNDEATFRAADEIGSLRMWKGKEVTAPSWGCYTIAVDPPFDQEHPAGVENSFTVVVRVPHHPQLNYFVEKFGEYVAKSAIEWWENIDAEEQSQISPRRLEQILQMWVAKGDIRDVVSEQCPITKLISKLNVGPVNVKIAELFSKKDVEGVKGFLLNENNFAVFRKWFNEQHEDAFEFFIPILSKDQMKAILWNECNPAIVFFCVKVLDKGNAYENVNIALRELLYENKNRRVIKLIRRAMLESFIEKTLPKGESQDVGNRPANRINLTFPKPG